MAISPLSPDSKINFFVECNVHVTSKKKAHANSSGSGQQVTRNFMKIREYLQAEVNLYLTFTCALSYANACLNSSAVRDLLETQEVLSARRLAFHRSSKKS